jgi:arylsulfatase A-like enzyme
MTNEPRTPNRPLTLADALVLASLGSVLAAIGHGAYVVLRVFGMNRFSWASRDILWTGSLSYALYLVPLTLLVFAITSLFSRRVRSIATAAVPFTLAGLAVLLLSRVVHPFALFVLSLGVSARLAMWIASDVPRTMRLARRVTLAAAAFCAIVSAGVRLGPSFREWRAKGDVAAASADSPNVLFIILDTVRAASMGMYGYHIPNTPNLERFAAEGVKFDWAFSPASWTLPSHASMFTGVDARATGAGWRSSLSPSHLTLGEYLADRGFLQAGFVANKSFTTWETGVHQGFHRWEDIGLSPMEIFWAATFSQTPLVRDLMGADSTVSRWKTLSRFNLRLSSESKHERRHANEIVDRFLEWQGDIGEKRFFAFLNLIDAHDPYEAPAPWATKWVARPRGRDHYDATIAFMDDELRRLFDALQQRGIYDRTLVIVGSDHGELFGERGLLMHGRSLYLNVVHVPLLMRFPPRIPRGVTISDPVGLERIPATILDILGEKGHPFPGRSLTETWDSTSIGHRELTAHQWIEAYPWANDNDRDPHGPIASVVDSAWHWLRDGRGGEELFRYREDRTEERDMAGSPDSSPILEAMRATARRAKLIR